MHNSFINIPYQVKNITLPYYNADIHIFPLISETAESYQQLSCVRGAHIYTGLWTLCLFALLIPAEEVIALK